MLMHLPRRSGKSDGVLPCIFFESVALAPCTSTVTFAACTTFYTTQTPLLLFSKREGCNFSIKLTFCLN